MISRRIFIALIAFPRLFLHAGTQVATPERRQVFGLPCVPVLLLLDGPQGPQISASATSYVDILLDTLFFVSLFGVIVYLVVPRSMLPSLQMRSAELKLVNAFFSALKIIVEISTSEDGLSEFADLLRKSHNSIIENFGPYGPSNVRLFSRTCDESSSSYEDLEESVDVAPYMNCKEQSPIIEEYNESSSLDVCTKYNPGAALKADAAVSSPAHSSVQEGLQLHISETSAGFMSKLASTSGLSCIDGDAACVSSEDCATSACDTSAVLGNQHLSGQSFEEQDTHSYKLNFSDVSASEDCSSSPGLDNMHASTTSVSADNSRADDAAQAEVGELGTGQRPHLKMHELKTCSRALESHDPDSCSFLDRDYTSVQSEALGIFNEHAVQSQVSEVVSHRYCPVNSNSIGLVDTISEGASSCPSIVRTGASIISETSTTIDANAPGKARRISVNKNNESTINFQELGNEILLESPSPNVSSCSSVSKYRTAPNPPATLVFSGSIHPHETDPRPDSIVELRFTAPNGDILRKESVNILAGDEHVLLGMESMNDLNERNSRCNGHRNASPTTTPKHKWNWFK